MKFKSFREMLLSQQANGYNENDCFLFTKLKQQKQKRQVFTVPNSLNVTITNSVLHSDTDSHLDELREKLQILKLDKANYIAQNHIKSGKPIKQIMQEVNNKLQQQIYKIIAYGQKIQSMKCSIEQQSTIGRTGSPHIQQCQNDKNKTPNLVQFTLGNLQNWQSPNSQIQRQNSNFGQQVSDFQVKISSTNKMTQKILMQ